MTRQWMLAFILSQAAAVTAQDTVQKNVTHFLAAQFAGSIGLVSGGYGLNFERQKAEMALLYGYLPRSMGGPVHTATFKIGYEPIRCDLRSNVTWTPFQLGCFVAQHFGRNLKILWDAHYPPNYYLWLRSTRLHVFVNTALLYRFRGNRRKSVQIYIEANSNDLYLATLASNLRTVSVLDPFFLGAGIKVLAW